MVTRVGELHAFTKTLVGLKRKAIKLNLSISKNLRKGLVCSWHLVWYVFCISDIQKCLSVTLMSTYVLVPLYMCIRWRSWCIILKRQDVTSYKPLKTSVDSVPFHCSLSVLLILNLITSLVCVQPLRLYMKQHDLKAIKNRSDWMRRTRSCWVADIPTLRFSFILGLIWVTAWNQI